VSPAGTKRKVNKEKAIKVPVGFAVGYRDHQREWSFVRMEPGASVPSTALGQSEHQVHFIRLQMETLRTSFSKDWEAVLLQSMENIVSQENVCF
jgi:hypothetical protein